MTAPKTTYQRWRYALKPQSWSKLFVPAGLGQGLGIAHLGRVDLPAVLLGMALTFGLLVFIVLLNDWGDQKVDAIKRRRFPTGCSPKTIPDGILPAWQLLAVGLVTGIATGALGFWADDYFARPGLGVATLVGLGTFVAYSLPPLRLNYRGGGELLEMLGVGLVLPWLNAYIQGGLGAEGFWLPRAWPIVFGLLAMSFSSAIASGLSDEMSDREGGKRTFTTTLGNAAARRLTEAMLFVGGALWLGAGIFAEHVPMLAVGLAMGPLCWHGRKMLQESTSAVTNAFAAQNKYKHELHLAFWRSARVLTWLLVVHRLFLAS